MDVSIEVDSFTPCLIEKATGAIIATEYEKANQSELADLQNQGWNFDWTAEHLKSATVYKLIVDGDTSPQGLIAVTNFKKDRAMYINLAESAPHNMGETKRYEGVGGHLFAIAAFCSLMPKTFSSLNIIPKSLELFYTECLILIEWLSMRLLLKNF